MATWHQQQNRSALQQLHTPERGKWKCVSDKPGQQASCMTYDNEADALAYCQRTGDHLIAPPREENPHD